MNYIVNNNERIKSVIFILLAVSLPYYHSLSSMLIIAASVLSVIRAYPFRQAERVNFDRLSIILFCYYILELIGLTYTEKENIRMGLFNVEKHLGLAFIPFIFFDYKVISKYRDFILTGFVVSCFIASIICIIGSIDLSLEVYNVYVNDWMFSHERLSGAIHMSPVYLSLYLSTSVLVVFYALLQEHKFVSGVKKVFTIFLFVYFFIFIISLGARTISVALILIIVAGLLMNAINKKSFMALLLAGIIPLIFMGFIFFHPTIKIRFMDMFKSNYENSNYGSYFARTKIWIPGVEVIKENILLGTGTGDDQAELNKKYIKYNYEEGVKNGYNLHNQYLQTQLSMGIAGLMAFLAIFLVQLKRAFVRQDPLYLSFLILFMLGCLTESMLCTHKGIVFFLFFSYVFYRSEKIQAQ